MLRKLSLHYIIRDHDREHFEARKKMMTDLAEELCNQYERDCVTVEIKDQYFNMREKVEPVMHIVTLPKKLWKQVGCDSNHQTNSGRNRWGPAKFYGASLPEYFCRRT